MIEIEHNFTDRLDIETSFVSHMEKEISLSATNMECVPFLPTTLLLLLFYIWFFLFFVIFLKKKILDLGSWAMGQVSPLSITTFSSSAGASRAIPRWTSTRIKQEIFEEEKKKEIKNASRERNSIFLFLILILFIIFVLPFAPPLYFRNLRLFLIIFSLYVFFLSI